MPDLPDEYNTMDFGFSMEDPPDQTPAAPVYPDTEAQMQVIEDKIDNLRSLLMEREAVEASPEVLLKIERLFMPFLINLQKNPEKEYIRWPDREVPIQNMIDKLLELTRGEGE